MPYKPNDTIRFSFAITDADGELTLADALPEATLTRNNDYAGGTALTVAALGAITGVYNVSGTIPSGWDEGDSIQIVVEATVDTVDAVGIRHFGVLEEKRVSELEDLDAADIRSAVGLASADLDTQLGTLSTLDAADIRSAVGLASADLDTQLGTLSTFDHTTDLVTPVDIQNVGFGDFMSVMLAVLGGETEVSGNTVTFQNLGGTTVYSITYGSSPGERDDANIV